MFYGTMRRLCRILVIFPPLLFLSLALFSTTSSRLPLVSLDLHSLGYLTPVAERDIRSLAFLDASPAFLDDETLAVSFLVANEHPGPSKRDAPMGSPVLFHTALLNPLNGQLYRQRSWGNAGNWQVFLPLKNSRFFVQDSDQIAVYSRDLEEIASARLQLTGDLYPRFALSPSGDTLFSFSDSYDVKNGWRTRIDIIDPGHLTSKPWTFTIVHRFEAVSNTRVVFALALQAAAPLGLFVQKIDAPAPSETRALFAPHQEIAKTIAGSGCDSATFVSESVLAISGNCSHVFLVRDGEIIQAIDAPAYRFGSDFRASRDRNRFAFSRSQSISHTDRIFNLEVCVYDMDRKQIIFTAPASPLPQHKLDYALSPDGSLFAVQSDNLLRVWSLPN